MLSFLRRLLPPPGRFELLPTVPLGFYPRRKTAKSAGYDLSVFLPEPPAVGGVRLAGVSFLVLQPGERVRLRTGVRLHLRAGWVALIFDRSSWRHRGLSMLGVGVIDADYQDEIGVIVANLSHEPTAITHGDACGQVLFTRAHTLGEQVAARRVGGFGSTDVRPRMMPDAESAHNLALGTHPTPERWPERVKLDLSGPRVAPSLDGGGQ